MRYSGNIPSLRTNLVPAVLPVLVNLQGRFVGGHRLFDGLNTTFLTTFPGEANRPISNRAIWRHLCTLEVKEEDALV